MASAQFILDNPTKKETLRESSFSPTSPEKTSDPPNKVLFSDKFPKIYDVSDLHSDPIRETASFVNSRNYQERETLSSSFVPGRIGQRQVLSSPFVNVARKMVLSPDPEIKIVERDRTYGSTFAELRDGLTNDYERFLSRQPGLERTKEFMRTLEKSGEKPKLIPLQNFSTDNLNELMRPVVQAVQTTVDNVRKMEKKMEKKDRENDKTLESILEKQGEIIGFMMQGISDRKDKKIRLKYKEIQQELDKVELGLSADYTKANFLMEELNYMLNRESELETIKTYEKLFFQYNEYLTKYSGPAVWYNQMVDNYKKTAKFLDEINPYKYLEARNKLREQTLEQKRKEMLERENTEALKGFILANKLKNQYEKSVREEIKDENAEKKDEKGDGKTETMEKKKAESFDKSKEEGKKRKKKKRKPKN